MEQKSLYLIFLPGILFIMKKYFNCIKKRRVNQKKTQANIKIVTKMK